MQDPVNRAIRQTYLKVRQQLSVDFQQERSHKICTRIRTLNQYRYAKYIALYHTINNEVDLGGLWRSAPLHGK